MNCELKENCELGENQARKSAEKPRSSQLKLLAGAVKRKVDPGSKEPVKVQKVQQAPGSGVQIKAPNATSLGSSHSKGDGGGGGLLGLGDYGSDSGSDSE